MFGIGLPEMILILALALIVVGPDKLPDLARSLAKGLMELKKTAEGLKQTITDEENPLDEIKPDLEEAAKALKRNLLETPYPTDQFVGNEGVNSVRDAASSAYDDLLKNTGQVSSDGKFVNDPSVSLNNEASDSGDESTSSVQDNAPSENSSDSEEQK